MAGRSTFKLDKVMLIYVLNVLIVKTIWTKNQQNQ